MNLYLVRHGQAVSNLESRHGGWCQLPLTEKGFDDTRRAGETLSKIPFDRIYSSDLKRAIQTACTALPGCEPIQLSVLRERSVGKLTEWRVEDCVAEYGEFYIKARAAADFTAFGGENLEMLQDRAAKFLSMLAESPAENIVAFTHEGFVKAAIDQVLGVQLKRSCSLVPNGAIIHFVYADDQWRLVFGA